MEKISNKVFIKYANSHFNNKELDLFNIFQTNLEKLETLIERRITHTYGSEESVYLSIIHHIETYFNSTKMKFVDLYRGYISCINSQSYSSTLLISRTLLENISMLDYLSTKFIKLIRDKNYIKLIQELANLSVPSWRTELVENYKRTHINDALRHFSTTTAFKEKSENEIFKIMYDPISEMSHPSASSFLMYQSHNNLIKNEMTKFQTSFSQNNEKIHGKVFPVISWVLVYPYLLIEELYPKVQKDLIDAIKNSKLEIDIHFKNNLDDLIKYNEIIKNLVLK